MTLPYWADTKEPAKAAWNTVTLGPVTLPGICQVSVQKGREVDVKKSKGKDGPTMKDTGAGQGKVTIEVTLVNDAQWQEWQRIRPTIDPNRPGGARSPLEIRHPLCADRGIKSVYVLNISVESPTARAGMRIKIEADEWVASPKAASSKTKTLSAKKLRQNSFVSDVAGETDVGQDFLSKLQAVKTEKDLDKERHDDTADRTLANILEKGFGK